MTTYQQHAYTTENLGQPQNLHPTGKEQGQRQNANLERYMMVPVKLPGQDIYPMQQASTFSDSAEVHLLQPQNTQMIVVSANIFLLICSFRFKFDDMVPRNGNIISSSFFGAVEFTCFGT